MQVPYKRAVIPAPRKFWERESSPGHSAHFSKKLSNHSLSGSPLHGITPCGDDGSRGQWQVNYPIGQHFIVGFEGTTVSKSLAKLIRKYRIGGVILFARNIESPRQVKKLISTLQKVSTVPLLVGVDHEGGNVFRLGAPFTRIPAMANVGSYFRKTHKIKTVRSLGELLGRELAAVGFNWNFAPVVDVHSNPKNPVIGQRAFSPNPLVVTRCASAIIEGLHSQGVISCAKHFPGHGATSADSHLTLPVLNDPGRLLWKRDLFPYRRLIAKKMIPTIMTAHVLYPELDEENCATLSRPIITGLLRKKIGFEGVVVSDDLRMKAISAEFGIPQATVNFFNAGGDMAMICREPDIQIEAIEHVIKIKKKDRLLARQLLASSSRLNRLKKRFLSSFPDFPLDVIGCPAHQKIVEKFSK